jgi:hypothetical protein
MPLKRLAMLPDLYLLTRRKRSRQVVRRAMPTSTACPHNYWHEDSHESVRRDERDHIRALLAPPNGLRLSRAAMLKWSQTQFYHMKTAATAPAAC